jgi:hypothetical protein
MKASGDISVSTDKRSLRFALLALSTIIILSASVYAYARVTYQTPLSVSGSNIGTGSTSAISFSPLLMIMPIILGIIISLSLFLTLRHASEHPRPINVKTRSTPRALSDLPSPSPLESGTPTNTPSVKSEEASIEPQGNRGLDAIDRILHSIRKKEEEAGENTGSSSTGSS